MSFLDLDLSHSGKMEACRVPPVDKFGILHASFSILPHLYVRVSFSIQSQYVVLRQVELLLGHGQVPHVPEYPEDQAEEDEHRSRQHKKVPKTQRCEDPYKEQGEAHNVQEHSQE